MAKSDDMLQYVTIRIERSSKFNKAKYRCGDMCRKFIFCIIIKCCSTILFCKHHIVQKFDTFLYCKTNNQDSPCCAIITNKCVPSYLITFKTLSRIK